MNYGIISVLAVFVILIVVFIFYEKKRVSVKEISIIAALAGLTGASRVPFVIFPNVQPATFLIIVSGYVFGPFFGFMIGMVATLVSNSFLGHGPWTPWQMLAWGIAGLSSGIMGKMIKRPTRWGLSIFGFIWGFLFDYIMNLWHWLFFVYPLNLKSFIATYAASFYFDFAHAVGNFVFCFFLGTSFINILMRFKDRVSYTEMSVQEID